MARPGISYEIVKDAYEFLVSKGKYPSIDRIRELLGTGSKTTIARHMKKLNAELNVNKSKQFNSDIIAIAIDIDKAINARTKDIVNRYKFENRDLREQLKEAKKQINELRRTIKKLGA